MGEFLIIAFAGYSGAGKSTLSKIISKTLGLEFIEHQQLLHDLSTSKGYERSRHWLKDVGIDEFIRESENEMARRIEIIASDNKKGAVIDVVYNKTMIDKLKDKFPEAKVVLVSVNTESHSRGERISGRMGNIPIEEGVAEREFRDKFLREAGMETVLANVDLSVTNNGDLEKTQQDLLLKLINKLN